MRRVTAFFNHAEDAENALAALEHAGFPRSEISMVSHNHREEEETPAIGPVHEVGQDTEAGRDAVIGGLAGTVAGLILALIPGIGLLAAVGPITGAIGGLGAGAAAGGIIGLFKDMGMSEEEAQYYAEGLRRGGAMLSVSCSEEKRELAESIMQQNGAVDIEERAQEWIGAGWTGFDPEAGPYPEVRRAGARRRIPK